MIWGSPPEDKPYSSREYDPFWQAAAELHMPLSLHVITGKSKESKVDFSQISLFYMNVIPRSATFPVHARFWRRAGAFSRTENCVRRK